MGTVVLLLLATGLGSGERALPGLPLGLGYVKGEWWLVASPVRELPAAYASKDGRSWRPVWRGFLFGGMVRRVYIFEDGMGRVWMWRMVPSFTLPDEWPPKKGESFRVESLLLGEHGEGGRFGMSFETPPRLVAFDRFRGFYIVMSSEEVFLSPMAPVWESRRLRQVIKLPDGMEVGPPFQFLWDPGLFAFASFVQRPPNPCLALRDKILLADGNRIFESEDWVNWEGPRFVRCRADRAEALFRFGGGRVGLLLSSGRFLLVTASDDGGRTWGPAHLIPRAEVCPMSLEEPLFAQGEEGALVLCRRVTIRGEEYAFSAEPIVVDEKALSDTDWDGLTDWEEEFFLADPRRPDTDGDGVLDGSDRFLRAPRRLPETEEERIFEAIFPGLPLQPERMMVAIIVKSLDEGGHMPLPEKFKDELIQTKFVHMTRGEFEGHFKRFPLGFVAVELEEVYFDPKGTKAVADVIIWGRPGAGRKVSFKLTKWKGKWTWDHIPSLGGGRENSKAQSGRREGIEGRTTRLGGERPSPGVLEAIGGDQAGNFWLAFSRRVGDSVKIDVKRAKLGTKICLLLPFPSDEPVLSIPSRQGWVSASFVLTRHHLWLVALERETRRVYTSLLAGEGWKRGPAAEVEGTLIAALPSSDEGICLLSSEELLHLLPKGGVQRMKVCFEPRPLRKFHSFGPAIWWEGKALLGLASEEEKEGQEIYESTDLKEWRRISTVKGEGAISALFPGPEGSLFLLARRWFGASFLSSRDGRRWKVRFELLIPTPHLVGPSRDGAVVAWARLTGVTFSPLLLTAPLSILTDGDRDGICDSDEKALLLDPKNPDTDGDGKPDGEDRFPNAHLRPPRSEEEAIFEAILVALARGFPYLQRAAVFFVKRPKGEWREFSLPGEPRFKVIYRDRRPSLPCIFIELIYFNRGRNRAYVEGGVVFAPLAGYGFELRLEKRGGRWVPVEKPRPTWIA